MWTRSRDRNAYCLWCGRPLGRDQRVWSNERHEVFCCTRCAAQWEQSRERWTCPTCGKYDCPDCGIEPWDAPDRRAEKQPGKWAA